MSDVMADAMVADMPLPAPRAAQKPHLVPSPHGSRQDPYYWLRDDSRSNPDMLAYLEAENDYYQQYRQRFSPLEQTLAQEMIGYLKADEDSVPYKDRNHYYYARYQPGHEYPIWARKRSLDGIEELLLDANEEARRARFFNLCSLRVSYDERLMVYGVDTQGRYQCSLRIRDLQTGKDFPEVVGGTSGSVAWAADGRSFFYVENDPDTLLTTQVKRHVVGTDPRKDTVVYREMDAAYYLSVSPSDDEKYVLLSLNSTTSDEYHVVPADKPEQGFTVLLKREQDFLATLDHVGDRWVIRHNWQAPNFRVAIADDKTIADRESWRDVVAHSESAFISGFDLFRDYLAISESVAGLQRLRVIDWRHGRSRVVDADEPAYTMRLDANEENDTEWLRYSYTSLTTPQSVYDVNMRTGERKLLKQQAVQGAFNKADYRTERIWVQARDGTGIPVSLVRHKSVKQDGSAPLLLMAYGAYGFSQNPSFDSDRLSLLNRGVVFALAHVRGGQELGRHWYDGGRLLNKMNTFTDYIDVSEYLVKQRYAAADKLFAMGGSAGGLLVGAVINMRPDLYKGALASVPFVDVVTSMLDESIPLTTTEFEEWGDPRQKAFYDYMLSYSPYDNVRAQVYPALLVTTGLHDSQVQYFEPAKWVAKLRSTSTGNAPLLLRVNMDGGHAGKSGRYQHKYDRAQDYAFLLNLAGIMK